MGLTHEGPCTLTVLGGGPAGLAIAFYAQRAGRSFDLYEGSETFGGLCRTHHWGRHRYDTGAHRLHDRDPEVTSDLRTLLGDELVRITAPSQIYDRGRFIDFPPTPLNLLRSTGVRGMGRIGVEILQARLHRAPPASFADFAVRQFGATLARRLVLDYSEKLWGLPASELAPEVATRRLQGMTFRSLVTELIVPRRKAAHIDGDFLYPRGGFGRIVERLAESLPAEHVHAGRRVTRLACADGRIRCITFADGRSVEPTDRVVSTLPITKLVELLGDAVPAAARAAVTQLRFRHVRLVVLRLARARVSRNASIYVPDPSLCICRVSEPRNRCATMAPDGETALVAEVPCFADDPVGRLEPAALAARVIDELVALGLITRAGVVDWVHHALANAYPVYALDYGRSVEAVLDGLGTIENLDTLGRGGRFVYSHLHDQMRFARDYVTGLGHPHQAVTRPVEPVMRGAASWRRAARPPDLGTQP